jgi:hypothetical protein
MVSLAQEALPIADLLIISIRLTPIDWVLHTSGFATVT